MSFPKKCPHCKKDLHPNIVSSSEHARIGNLWYRAEIHACPFCKNPIFVLRNGPTQDISQLTCVPYYFPMDSFVAVPELIERLSPNACASYTQSIQARSHDFDRLVGAGLRITLEWLMFDYLTKLKNHTTSELEGKKLHQLIDMVKQYNPSQYTDICTKLIRIYGNDQIHLFKKTDLTDGEIIAAFGILFDIIESEIKVINANNRLQGLPEII